MTIIYRQTDDLSGCDTDALCSAHTYYVPHVDKTFQAQVDGDYGDTIYSHSWQMAKANQVSSFLTIYLAQDPTEIAQAVGDVEVKLEFPGGIIAGTKMHSLHACKVDIGGDPSCTNVASLGSVTPDELLTAGIKEWTIPDVQPIASPTSDHRLAIVCCARSSNTVPSFAGLQHWLRQDITHHGWSSGIAVPRRRIEGY